MINKKYNGERWLKWNGKKVLEGNILEIKMKKKRVTVIRINKKEFRRFVDDKILEAPKDEEFRKALAWLDRTKSIDGNIYDKVFQLLFGFDQNALSVSKDRMNDFMRDSVWRNGK